MASRLKVLYMKWIGSTLLKPREHQEIFLLHSISIDPYRRPMYKKRFKIWDVHKYKRKPTFGVPTHKARMAKHGMKNPIERHAKGLASKYDIASHTKAGSDSEERYTACHVERLVMDDNACFKSSVNSKVALLSAWDDLHHAGQSPVGPLRSAREDTQLSNSDAVTVLTPSSSEATSHPSPPFPAWKRYDAAWPDKGTGNRSAIEHEGRSRPEGWDESDGPCNSALPPCINKALGALDLVVEAPRFSDSNRIGAKPVLNPDRHMLETNSRSRAGPYRDTLRLPAELGQDPEPSQYVALCYLACICDGQGRTYESRKAASDAADLFNGYVKKQHPQALACLDIVLTVLYYHGLGEFAVRLFEDARAAALHQLGEGSHLVSIIKFMIAQATSDAKECEISLGKLKIIYEEFQRSRGRKDPQTLIAGYNYAWRLALEDEAGQNAALRLLFALQNPMDSVFGLAHIEAIGNLTTQARVLQHLGRPNDAERTMNKAVSRVDQAFHEIHPYSLETKRRHAELLKGIGQNRLAEKKLIEVAVGRMEVLGPENKLSKRSIEHVNDFLDVLGREGERADFDTRLVEALRRRSTRTPEFDF